MDRDFLSSLTSMILKSGHGSLLTKIISTSSFEQEVTLKNWICELENLQVKVGMNLIPGEPTVDRTYYIYFIISLVLVKMPDTSTVTQEE